MRVMSLSSEFFISTINSTTVDEFVRRRTRWNARVMLTTEYNYDGTVAMEGR